MAIDSMNKVIHAAVRRDLTRLDGALAGFPAGDHERAVDLDRAWSHLSKQLHEHHETEDDLLWPVLRRLGLDDALLAEMEAEHREMARALDAIDVRMKALTMSAAGPDAAAALDSVRRGRGVVDKHLDHEEGELEPRLRPHLESPEWKAAEKQLRRQPPRQAGWLFAWLQDGAPDEAMAYLGGMVPGPVRWTLGTVLGRGYHRQIAPVWR